MWGWVHKSIEETDGGNYYQHLAPGSGLAWQIAKPGNCSKEEVKTLFPQQCGNFVSQSNTHNTWGLHTHTHPSFRLRWRSAGSSLQHFTRSQFSFEDTNWAWWSSIMLEVFILEQRRFFNFPSQGRWRQRTRRWWNEKSILKVCRPEFERLGGGLG